MAKSKLSKIAAEMLRTAEGTKVPGTRNDKRVPSTQIHELHTQGMQHLLGAVQMDKLTSLFKSRRAWATLSGMLVVLFQQGLGLDQTTAMSLVALIGAWVLGDSLKNTQ